MVLSDDLLDAAHLTEAEVRAELALSLFAQDRLTLGQATRLAGLPYLEFQALLASRKIPLHYGIEEFEADVDTLNRLADR
jgi:predicted HTH domain antitoxin